MAGNPRENARGKGFWGGGSKGRATESESGGRETGFPGRRAIPTVGILTDLDGRPEAEVEQSVDDNTIDNRD